ncbi:MAG: hypothetical protein ACKVGY_02820, partial [Candidatus Poseidoniales archaeon]
MSEDSISPVDARRVVLIDGLTSGVGMNGNLISMGSYVFFFPFLIVLGILTYAIITERWIDKVKSRNVKKDLTSLDKTKRKTNFKAFSIKKINAEWKNGSSLIENQFRRYVSLCVLYVAQGLPAGFTY